MSQQSYKHVVRQTVLSQRQSERERERVSVCVCVCVCNIWTHIYTTCCHRATTASAAPTCRCWATARNKWDIEKWRCISGWVGRWTISSSRALTCWFGWCPCRATQSRRRRRRRRCSESTPVAGVQSAGPIDVIDTTIKRRASLPRFICWHDTSPSLARSLLIDYASYMICRRSSFDPRPLCPADLPLVCYIHACPNSVTAAYCRNQ